MRQIDILVTYNNYLHAIEYGGDKKIVEILKKQLIEVGSSKIDVDSIILNEKVLMKKDQNSKK